MVEEQAEETVKTHGRPFGSLTIVAIIGLVTLAGCASLTTGHLTHYDSARKVSGNGK